MFSSLLSCCGIALLFVLVLNFVSGPDTRNRPDVVRLRIISALLVSLLTTLYVVFVFGVTLEDLGLKRRGSLVSVILSLISVILLYLGPLVQPLFKRRFGLGLISHLAREYVQDDFSDRWDIAVRNLIVAPLTEEWIFRACMMSLLLPVMKPWMAIVVSPMLFALCHFHHLFEWYRNPTTPFKEVGLGVLFQVCYTFVFGTFVAYLFVMTEHIMGPIAAHAFCNCMGIPPINEISQTNHPTVVWIFYVIGLLLFFVYLYALSLFITV